MTAMPVPILLFAMLFVTALAGAPLCAESAADRERLAKGAAATFEHDIRPLLARYCAECHGKDKQKGDVDFSHLATGAAALSERTLWKSVREQLGNGVMPPPKQKQQPDAAEREALLTWIRTLRALDAPDPGRVTARRLNRAEYDNTMRDLLGLDAKPAADFPFDDVGSGFDNNGDVLSISPLLMEKYLVAADALLDKVVVDDQLSMSVFGVEMAATVDGRSEAGRPVSTGTANQKDKETAESREARRRIFTGPGEVATTFTAPKDGRYTIKVRAGGEAAGGEPIALAVKVDGQLVGEARVTVGLRSPTAYSVTTPLGAGVRTLTVIWMNPNSEPPAPPGSSATPAAPAAPAPAKPAKPGTAKPATASTPKAARTGATKERALAIDGIDIIGPPAGMPSELHKRLFVAVPGKDLERKAAAQRIAERFALRAFRRPASDEQIERLLRVFALADAQGEVFSEAIKLMLKAALISPEFFFRIEDDHPADSAGIYAIDDWELATRLSYFLWSTMPDEELFTQARSGKLHEPMVLEAQVRRMLKDTKSRALVDNFAGQWLQLRNIFIATPDQKAFPEFTKDVRQAMYDEGALFFDAILHEDRSMLEFIDSDWTFLNARLAKFYGIAGVEGTAMKKVQLSDPNRGGVITLGALLTVTSTPTRTSPVKRGKWVLEEILGTPPPPPPAVVPPIEDQERKDGGKQTMRQMLVRHRADPGCASCHVTMDAIGFGFENFDVVGRWRDHDTGGPIDSAGELPGGRRFSGPAQLKKLFMERKDDFVRVFTGKLMTYALGRRMEDPDEAVIDRIAAAVAADGYRMSRLIIELTRSYPFLNRRLAR